MTNVFIEGKQIYLRALNENDLNSNYINWFNDEEVCKYNGHHRFVNTKEKTIKYIESVNSSTTNLVLAICTKDKNIHIGNVSIQNINYIDSNGEFAIIMGEKDFHGKGLAFESASLIINHAFHSLNLHRIYCGTSNENIPMQKLANKLGMKQEGYLEESMYKNGKYVDILLYGLINNQN